MNTLRYILLILVGTIGVSCASNKKEKSMNPWDILGNPKYRAISYGGYRLQSREQQPTVAELKEDMKLLEAIGVKVLRTYNVHFAHAGNVLQAIRELKMEDPDFEMYVMLGAWINCKGAFTEYRNHYDEDLDSNSKEIETAVELANKYSDIVKIIAVGNEAMVKWAESYYVQPWVILKYVNHLQSLKTAGKLPSDVLITSSDNFASWGGGGAEYHVPDLAKLYKAVDYVSIHTYPMHDTHYNPAFWGLEDGQKEMRKKKQILIAMTSALQYAKDQYKSTKEYMRTLGVDKPMHIGETGWASSSNGFYGNQGSKACDEYKEGVYHQLMRDWTDKDSISCFYFEGFDEIWKDAGNPGGSENFFGLFDKNGQAKYALWDLVDQGVFEGLSRGGRAIRKTYDGDEDLLLDAVSLPPMRRQ